ncbi:MAG: hypothetical protein AB4368_04665 [Xenococcaceae cyanobacterium]
MPTRPTIQKKLQNSLKTVLLCGKLESELERKLVNIHFGIIRDDMRDKLDNHWSLDKIAEYYDVSTEIILAVIGDNE